MEDKTYMQIALKEAYKAYQSDEVPVGAVIVCDGEVVAKAHNQREFKQSTLSHAEIEVIKTANKVLKSWRLDECTLYSSLEPCMMCAGAIQQARIKRVVYAADDDKYGFMRQLLKEENLNHYPIVQRNVLDDEAKNLLESYFFKKRKNAVKVKEANETILDEYYKLREKVFVKEQKVSIDEEYDCYDKNNNQNIKHIVAVKNEIVIGTMRLIFNREASILRIGRLAIEKEQRNLGIGKKLLNYAEVQAKNNGLNCLELGAQLDATGFYEASLFKKTGTIFLDAGIEHITMIKRIKK